MKLRQRGHLPLTLSLCTVLLASSQLTQKAQAKPAAEGSPSLFVESAQDFPRIEENMRKWDTPVVADLDQDGYPDLILNDHGFSLKLMWNNKGKYAKPYDMIMGDMHGVTVGDYDFDGLLEVIVSRGGGSGSNARNAKTFRIGRDRSITEVPDFKEPLAFMRGRTLKLIDGNNDGALDLLNFAFPSKEKKGESENYIYTNDGKGELLLTSTLDLKVRGDGQKTLVTDFNNDNIPDLFIYGRQNVSVFSGNKDLTYTNVTDKVLPTTINKASSIIELDFDNDGDFDIYISRKLGMVPGETFYNKETQTWAEFVMRGAYEFNNIMAADVLEIENFHVQWPSKDLFIGESAYKYEFPGETHTGKDLRLINSDALGFPDKPTEKGTYIGYVGNGAWKMYVNNFSSSTIVLHGVTDYPAYDHKTGLKDILLENKNGKFVDVSNKAGINIAINTTGSTSADIDNNGYEDLVVISRGNLVDPTESLVFLNQGDGTFKRADNHNIISTELGSIGLGVERVDYNRDGFVDIIYGNEKGKWHLFKNTQKISANANYLTIDVGHSKSKKATALGALVSIDSCGMTQQRRMGASSAAYALNHDTLVHFGLGSCKGPIAVTVKWTNGETETRKVKSVNRIEKIGK